MNTYREEEVMNLRENWEHGRNGEGTGRNDVNSAHVYENLK